MLFIHVTWMMISCCTSYLHFAFRTYFVHECLNLHFSVKWLVCKSREDVEFGVAVSFFLQVTCFIEKQTLYPLFWGH